MHGSKKSSATHTPDRLCRILSPADQLAIAHQLQTIRKHEDQFRAYAEENWGKDERKFIRRLININRKSRLEIWRILNITSEACPSLD